MSSKGGKSDPKAAAPASAADSKKDGKPGAAAAGGKGAAAPGAPAMPDKKEGRGHKQKGAGTVVVAKKEVVAMGLVLKEHERTPMTLLQEWCQREKRPRPRYDLLENKDGKVRYRLVVQDAKKPGTDKDLIFMPSKSFEGEYYLQGQLSASRPGTPSREWGQEGELQHPGGYTLTA